MVGKYRRRGTTRRDTRRRGTTRRDTRRRGTTRRDTRRRGTTRRDTRIKNNNVHVKKSGDKKGLRVFVINLDRNKDRWKKYAAYNSSLPNGDYVKYEKFKAVDGNSLRNKPVSKQDKEDIEYFQKIVMMWNAGDKQRGNVVGCLLSHIRLMRKIVKGNMNKVLVMEDDALIDMNQLKKINLDKMNNKMIYFGGVLRPLKFKDPNWNYDRVKREFTRNKINKIDSSLFKIGSTHGLYYPTKDSAKNLLDHLESKERIRAIDSELAIIQKKNPELLDSIYYPAIVYLVIEEAQKGFSGQYFKKDGFDRSMKEY